MPRFLFMDLMEGRLSLELTAIQVACHAARHLLLQSSNNPWFPPSSLFLLVICLGCHLVQCPGFRELSPMARQGAELTQEASEMRDYVAKALNSASGSGPRRPPHLSVLSDSPTWQDPEARCSLPGSRGSLHRVSFEFPLPKLPEGLLASSWAQE